MPYYGFNFQWVVSSTHQQSPQKPDFKALDFLWKHGFNFVRIPCDYRFWVSDFNYQQPNEAALTWIDQYLDACMQRNLHMCLNLHRAPGYCINGNEEEKHNLWLDAIAQDGFVFQWELFAKRYCHIPASALSFDLVNEPPEIGQYGMTRQNHALLIRRVTQSIWQIDPHRPITIDGLAGGHLAMPELADLNVTHSGRGYQPMPVSHHQATWWPGYAQAPEPVYPGLHWDGRLWDKAGLVEFYQPWRDVEALGRPIHIGEMGCYNKTSNDLALRWFGDLLRIFKDFRWGFSFWNFDGPFGIIEHGRAGANYQHMDGYNVDVDLLALMLENRV